jgi:glyoxylase-like metal-dependent hydrolase (beta-lactamase superfamily II)
VSLIFSVLLTLLWLPVGAQDARGALDAAAAAMGASTLHAVEYSAATGNAYALGQAAGPGKPWPRFTVTKYSMQVNYDAPVMREQTVRIDDEKPPRGGGAGGYNPETQQGGIRPIPFGSMTTTAVRDGRTEDGALQIWLTPHGFLKGAAANATTLTAGARDRNGSLALSFKAFNKYTVTGTLTRDNLVERVQTTVAHPLYGDMVLEAVYSGYKDVGGVKVPSRIVQRQGGFPILDVPLSDAQPGSAAAAALTAPAPAGGQGQGRGQAQGQGQGRGQAQGQAPAGLPSTELAPGFWAIGGAGGAQSFVIDFRDFAVVVEAAGNPGRVELVIAEARKLTANRPIRYVINTHQHADHSGGLRAVVAEGLTLLTHEVNVPFYQKMLRSPATIAPDRLAGSPRPPILEGVGDRKVITDGTRTIEVHHVRGQLHSEGMLMIYLPKERMLIQSDMYSPRPPEAKPLPWSPHTANFYENIQRLKLDVAQMVHVHGGMDPMERLVEASRLPH